LNQLHHNINRQLKPLTDLYRILCHNRSRQRRNLCKVLNDWDLLQEEAEHIDKELQKLTHEEPIMTDEGDSYSFHLSSWVYHTKLELLEDIFFLGFELELYGTHEFVMIYWYIDYLLGVHYQHLERTHMHITDIKYKDQHGSYRSTSSPASSVSLLVSQQMMMMAKQDICRGIHRTISALQKTGHVISPQLEFDDESTRFLHRFRICRTLGSPTILSYKDFKEMTQFDNVTALELINASLQNFQAARSSIESLLAMEPLELKMDFCHVNFTKELRDMLRVCIANIVNLHKIIEEYKPMLDPNNAKESDIITTSKPILDPNNDQESSDTTTSRKQQKKKQKSKKPLRKDNKIVNFEFKYHPWYTVITLK
ncbi:2281_t:CDS:2, partial [Funneliformis caledonium]